jgi:hypothetical protein
MLQTLFLSELISVKFLWNQPVVTMQLDFFNEDSILLGYIMNFCRLTNISEEHDAFQFRTMTEKTVFSVCFFFNFMYRGLGASFS